jgi:uncharacterized protein (TIGR00251 family)
MKEIKDSRGGRIRFRVRVQAAAPKNELLGWNEAGELRIKVAARPRQGEANRELIAFLAKHFHVAKRDIEIESGGKSRTKSLSAPSSIREPLEDLPDS